MKTSPNTYYLTLFLIADLVIIGVLLCFFREKEWWNNWMITAPNLYMMLGALYCPMMKKNLDAKVDRQTWIYIYKGIKIGLTIIMLALFIFFAKQGEEAVTRITKIAFVIITAIAYLIGLFIETYSFMDYLKHKKQ